jgi:alanyl-tRNA synthetase
MEYVASQGEGAGRGIDGRFLFKLCDTYGFPRDLAEEVLRDRGWQVTGETESAWTAEMEAQRKLSREGATFGAAADEESQKVYQALAAELPKAQFVGFEALASPARILAMLAGGRRRREAVAGDEVEVLLDRTPFYAESGGQIGDTGQVTGRQGRGEVLDTQYRGPLVVHRLRVAEGGFREGEDVAVAVESPRRRGLQLHHTGTHLLHAALRRVLGTHVTQAGSLVAPDRLRFDITHGQPVKDRDLTDVEDLVNEKVQDNIVVDPFETDYHEAIRQGAMALFGEKYGDRVRVIRIGDFSTELCGGTHLDATGQIGLFKIVGESAVAAGVRRLEAVTGPAALRHVGQEEAALRETAELLKIPPLEVPRRLGKLLEEQRALEKRLAELEARLAKGRAQELVAGAQVVGPVRVVKARLDGLDQAGLRSVVDAVREKLPASSVIILGGVANDAASLVTAVSKDLTRQLHAGNLVKEGARAVQGTGGGRPDLAQAGGKHAAGLDQALADQLRLVSDAVAAKS